MGSFSRQLLPQPQMNDLLRGPPITLADVADEDDLDWNPRLVQYIDGRPIMPNWEARILLSTPHLDSRERRQLLEAECERRF